jgi:hypothetical protein
MEKKYTTISHEINKLTEQNAYTSDHTFYPRIVNKTDIKFTPNEEILLQKGLKYNLLHKPKHWISTLAIETENSITFLPTLHHGPLRYLVAQCIEHLYQQQNTDKKLPTQSYNELRTIKQKMKNNEAIVTKAHKGNSSVILYLKDYNTKVQNFIDTNNFQKEAIDPTNKFQTQIRKKTSIYANWLSPTAKNGNVLT